ncbi:hypothetical protein CCUS01_10615, partial [Colletotrichum cuscutae]
IPQRIGFSAGQGFQSTYLPGYSDAPGLRSHLLLSLSVVVSCFYISPSAIAGEEDNDTNEFTQLKLKKKKKKSLVNTLLTLVSVSCNFAACWRLAKCYRSLRTKCMLAHRQHHIHNFQKPRIQTRQVPCHCNYNCGSQATAWTAY